MPHIPRSTLTHAPVMPHIISCQTAHFRSFLASPLVMSYHAMPSYVMSCHAMPPEHEQVQSLSGNDSSLVSGSEVQGQGEWEG